MLQKKKVLILSKNADAYEALLTPQGCKVKIAVSEAEIFDSVRTVNYDMIIVDCEQGPSGMKGSDILEHTASIRTSDRPFLLGITRLQTEEAIGYYSEFHADKVLRFPDVESKLVSTVKVMFAEPKDPTFEKRKRYAVKDIFNILTEHGFKASNKGTLFLAEAITEVIYRPEIIKSLSKSLYPDIAQRYSTTAEAVERTLRFTIEKVYDGSNSSYIRRWATALKNSNYPYY